MYNHMLSMKKNRHPKKREKSQPNQDLLVIGLKIFP